MLEIVGALHNYETDTTILELGDEEIDIEKYTDVYALVDEEGTLDSIYETYFDAELSMCQQQGGVAIGPDYLGIYDNLGEVGYWIEDEWIEEPQLTLNLANAVRLYYTKGPAFIREILGK